MQIILISHGELSRGALQAATMIIGECDNISAAGLAPEDDLESMAAKVEAIIEEKNAGDEEILILSDLFFGSPFNSVVPLMAKYKLRHVAGMNLAMIIEAAGRSESGEDIDTIAAACMETGKEGIIDVNAFLDA